MNEHEALVEETVQTKHTVVLFGGLDTGKSTLSRALLEAAVAAGRPSAFLDADVGQKTRRPARDGHPEDDPGSTGPRAGRDGE